MSDKMHAELWRMIRGTDLAELAEQLLHCRATLQAQRELADRIAVQRDAAVLHLSPAMRAKYYAQCEGGSEKH
jgi:hypothetical protein